MSSVQIGAYATSGHAKLSVEQFLETRGLLQANSGGGKSYALRRIIEVLCGRVQQIIIDTEGEFASLRAALASSREQADLAVQPAQAALDAAKVPYQTHRVIGQDRARSIVETAQQLACHHLVMGTARKNSLTRMVEDSVTSRVLELTTVPVEVISGGAVSKIERIGLMAFVALGIAIVVLAVY
jgi:nucleotide-binding universal stress UspA family protein